MDPLDTLDMNWKCPGPSWGKWKWPGDSYINFFREARGTSQFDHRSLLFWVEIEEKRQKNRISNKQREMQTEQASHFKFSFFTQFGRFLHVFASVSFCVLNGWSVDAFTTVAVAVEVAFFLLNRRSLAAFFLTFHKNFNCFRFFLSFAFIYLLRSVYVFILVYKCDQ